MRNDCPDCSTELMAIEVLDRGFLDSPQKGLMYMDPNAKKGLLGRFKTDGVIEAKMCGDCGRVLLYAVPRD